MKQFNSFKTLLLVVLLGATSATVQAQNYQPLAFGVMGGAYGSPNYYLNYVGLNMICTAPASIGGSYIYTYPGADATGAWGGVVTTPLVGDTLKLAPPGDTAATAPYVPTYTVAGVPYFQNRIAVIWRGPVGATAVDFSQKAYFAQQAGALACIIINEYAGEGPVGMAGGTDGTLVTIPVFQVGNIPGTALDGALHNGPVTFTITPWGTGLANNLGFVPGGTATSGNYAVPYNQLVSSSPASYLGLDGAFVANYGTNNATHVKVAATLQFGGSVVNTDTTEVLDTFKTTDSIWAMFVPTTYNISASHPGRFDLTYNIISDSVDQALGSNTKTVSFYASDSVYSKGTYDFTNNVPLSTLATGPVNSSGTAEDFVWGNMYYVDHHDGSAFSSVQFSLNNGFLGPLSGTVSSVDVLVFRWIDGSNGQPRDSIVQNGELDCVTLASYNFQPNDTSETIIKTFPLGQLNSLGDTIDGTYTGPVYLQDTSFYYVAVNVGAGMSIYCDGQTDPYPRIFGHFYNASSSYLDNSNILVTGDYTAATAGNPGVLGSDALDQGYSPTAFPGNFFIQAVDSFNYGELRQGLIPSIALITTGNPPAPVAVKNVTNPSNILSVFPIPTSDNLTVSLNLNQMSNTVTYTILDGLARFVSKQTHNNVTKEQFDIPTSNLPSGTYFLIVDANGRAMSRKFIVVR